MFNRYHIESVYCQLFCQGLRSEVSSADKVQKEKERLECELDKTARALLETQSRLEGSIETQKRLELSLQEKETEMNDLVSTPFNFCFSIILFLNKLECLTLVDTSSLGSMF